MTSFSVDWLWVTNLRNGSDGFDAGEFQLLELVANVESSLLDATVAPESRELLVHLAQFRGSLRGVGEISHVGTRQHRFDFEKKLRDSHPRGVSDLGDDLGDFLRLLRGVVPQAPLRDFEVFGQYLVGSNSR